MRVLSCFYDFNDVPSQVIDESIIQEFEEQKKWRLVLADYFENVSSDDQRSRSELPYQLQKAKENKRLLNFMRKDLRGMKMNPLAKNKFYKVEEIKVQIIFLCRF